MKVMNLKIVMVITLLKQIENSLGPDEVDLLIGI